ncbi:hypothetical protein [Nonomuraea sp. NPDC001831]|uniref:hypothetical protein n=1 Tax=Nonomuraea sp. NPDC001831 TaxID=3364340 RepID=UPI0036CE25D9
MADPRPPASDAPGPRSSSVPEQSGPAPDPRSFPGGDDLRAVRDLYGHPAPAPYAQARVWRRVAAGRRRRRLTRLSALSLATATAAALAVALMLVRGTPPAVPGRSILLAAASTAASGQQAAYWHISRVHDGDRLTELWATRDGRAWTCTFTPVPDSSLTITSTLSPTSSPVPDSTVTITSTLAPTSTPVPDSTVTITSTLAPSSPPAASASDPGRATTPAPPSGPASGESCAGHGRVVPVTGRAPFTMAGRDLTFRQIQELPADPAALKERVAAMLPAGSAGLLADALSGLLWSKPSPPAVRAAAYRALADLPDVRYLGGRADPLGRPGEAFSYPLPTGVRRTLIIDPATSQVLAGADAGGSGGSQIVLTAGWTDQAPDLR